MRNVHFGTDGYGVHFPAAPHFRDCSGIYFDLHYVGN